MEHITISSIYNESLWWCSWFGLIEIVSFPSRELLMLVSIRILLHPFLEKKTTQQEPLPEHTFMDPHLSFWQPHTISHSSSFWFYILFSVPGFISKDVCIPLLCCTRNAMGWSLVFCRLNVLLEDAIRRSNKRKNGSWKRWKSFVSIRSFSTRVSSFFTLLHPSRRWVKGNKV